MSKSSTVDGKETLNLTEWELGNLHLPPVTTVTLYEGSAPVEFLRSRIEKMLGALISRTASAHSGYKRC